MSSPAPFDLTTEPWIPALDVHGAVHELSLVDVVARAEELVAIGGELPTTGFALTRLVLAVLHRAVEGPADQADWADLWRTPGLPTDDVVRYLGRWRHRFDLFHPETPFFQVAGLATAKGEFSGLEKLIADVPNGHPYFTTRSGAALRHIPAAEAARWLVHAQAFDPSGIKSGAVGDDQVKGGKGYPIGIAWAGNLGGVLVQGPTLRDTLLLNLVPRQVAGLQLRWGEPLQDVPLWERAALTAGRERPGGRPQGPADLYTWSSRRMRLRGAADGVTGVLIANGDPLEVQNQYRFEPMSAWRRSTAQEKKRGEPVVYMPREHRVERVFWRGLAGLLPQATGGAQGRDAAATLPPASIEWLAIARRAGLLQADYLLRTRAVGLVYGSNNSVVDEVIDDELSLSVAVLQADDRALGQLAVAAVSAAEGAVRALSRLASNLHRAAGGYGDGPGDRAGERGFAALDSPFRRWVARLTSQTDLVDAETGWHLRVRGSIRGVADELLAETGPAAWVGREVDRRHLDSSLADVFFTRALQDAVPRAFATGTGVSTKTEKVRA